jgi:hypothetical protein
MTTTASHHGATSASAPGLDTCRAEGDVLVIRTVADLAAALSALPPYTPVKLDRVLRGAPGLSPDHHPHVVVADAGALAYRDPRTRGGGLWASLELGARLVPEEAAPVPPDAQACDPLQRMADAFDAGDLGDGLRALANALSDAAHEVATEGAAWLPPESRLHGQLHDVATNLRQIATDVRSCLASAVDAEMRRAELA